MSEVNGVNIKYEKDGSLNDTHIYELYKGMNINTSY